MGAGKITRHRGEVEPRGRRAGGELDAYESDVRFNMPQRSHGRSAARVNVEPTANNSAPSGGDVRERDDAPLPLAYGSDRLELTVRDPMWAHAYWEISIDRIKDAVGSPGGRKVFLRLIGVPTGYRLAEHAVRAERGGHGFALPEADSSYMVELAIMRDYSWVVLARSNVVHAPSRKPRSATAPAFVSRAHQLRALTDGRALELAGGGSGVLPPRMGGSPPAARTAAMGRSQVGAPASMGSETRLVRFDSEPRLAQPGSDARLVRREPVHIPFVIARSRRIPELVAGALSGLAAAVWFGRDPVDVLAAGNALARALADAGIPFGPTVDRAGARPATLARVLCLVAAIRFTRATPTSEVTSSTSPGRVTIRTVPSPPLHPTVAR